MGFLLSHVGHGGCDGGTWLSRRGGRTVTVHDLDQARQAIAAAGRDGVDLTLVSAPSAAASGGPAWFKALVDAATADTPDIQVSAVLDCGARPGDALAALRSGWRTIVYTGPAAAKLRQIARQTGAVVLSRRP